MAAYNKSIGKVIYNIYLSDNYLTIEFADGSKLTAYDDGQSCCERRYMQTDDDLTQIIGDTLVDILIKDAPNVDDGEAHEVQVITSITAVMVDFV